MDGEDLGQLADDDHPVLVDVVETADERRDERRPGLGREQALVGGLRGCAPGAHGGRGKHRGERRPRGRGLFGVSPAAPRLPAVVLRRLVYAAVGSSARQQRSPHGRARFPVADVDLSKRSQPGVQRVLCVDEHSVRHGRQCGLRPSSHLPERSHQPGDLGPGDPAAIRPRRRLRRAAGISARESPRRLHAPSPQSSLDSGIPVQDGPHRAGRPRKPIAHTRAPGETDRGCLPG